MEWNWNGCRDNPKGNIYLKNSKIRTNVNRFKTLDKCRLSFPSRGIVVYCTCHLTWQCIEETPWRTGSNHWLCHMNGFKPNMVEHWLLWRPRGWQQPNVIEPIRLDLKGYLWSLHMCVYSITLDFPHVNGYHLWVWKDTVFPHPHAIANDVHVRRCGFGLKPVAEGPGRQKITHNPHSH